MSRTEDSAFEDLLGYIGRKLDFETDFYNNAYLDRRITARMRRTDTDSYRTYQRLLESDDEEKDALLGSLSINVTGFFRNPEAWEKLRGVLRDLTDEHRRVRIWSAPCADGREPYSIAMLALDDPEIRERSIEITATDINRDILEVARSGVYETSQTSDIAAELEPLNDYEAYIEHEGDRFSVKDRVKEMISFEQHDLIRGNPKRDFDLVLCRNLLIYIDSSFKAPIFETIRNSLRADGYLMIGMTETIPTESRDDFEPVHKQQRIYRRS